MLTSQPTTDPRGKDERIVLPYTPPEEVQFLIDRVKKRMRVGDRLSARWALDRSMYENILFYLGAQWLDYDANARRFTALNPPKWFPTPVDNQIQPRADRLMAQFLKRKPTARVRPNTNEPADREAARSAEYLVAHIDDVVNEADLRQRASSVVVLTGTVFSKEWFNPNAGPQMEVPVTQTVLQPALADVAECPACGADSDATLVDQPCPSCGMAALQPAQRQRLLSDGSPAMDAIDQPVTDPTTGQPVTQKFRLGEIQSEIIMPFEFMWDENADRLDKAEWCGQFSYRSIEWIERNFPEVAPYVAEESGVEASNLYRAALLNIMGPSGRGPGMIASGGTDLMRGGAMVLEYQERASKQYPKGMHLIVAGNVLAYYGELPVTGKDQGEPEFSFSDFCYSIVPGRLPGTTPIDQMLSLQRRLNGILAQLTINRKTMVHPWILAPEASGLKPGTIALRPGTVVTYNSIGVGTAPQIVQGQPLPEQVITELKMILDSMDRIAATEDVMMGDAPSGVKSGVALAQLGEASETTHAPRMSRWEAWIATRARKRLLLAQKHYHEGRLVKIMGAGSEWQVRRLSGADLRGNTDVTVEAGSSLPRSRMAQLQLIFDALNAGLFGEQLQDPSFRQKILDEMGLTSLQTDAGPDVKKALAENAMMEQGMVPPVGQYEDKVAHLREHMQVVKDPAFTDKPPPVQQAYLQHIQATRLQALIEMQSEFANGGTNGQPSPGTASATSGPQAAPVDAPPDARQANGVAA